MDAEAETQQRILPPTTTPAACTVPAPKGPSRSSAKESSSLKDPNSLNLSGESSRPRSGDFENVCRASRRRRSKFFTLFVGCPWAGAPSPPPEDPLPATFLKSLYAALDFKGTQSSLPSLPANPRNGAPRRVPSGAAWQKPPSAFLPTNAFLTDRLGVFVVKFADIGSRHSLFPPAAEAPIHCNARRRRTEKVVSHSG